MISSRGARPGLRGPTGQVAQGPRDGSRGLLVAMLLLLYMVAAPGLVVTAGDSGESLHTVAVQPGSHSHLHPERYYQELTCRALGGQLEYVLTDHARVDCLTADYAIEVDFAPKWAESIGQALYYAQETGKRPGVILILEHPAKDVRYLRRLSAIAQRYGITVWTIFVAP